MVRTVQSSVHSQIATGLDSVTRRRHVCRPGAVYLGAQEQFIHINLAQQLGHHGKGSNRLTLHWQGVHHHKTASLQQVLTPVYPLTHRLQWWCVSCDAQTLRHLHMQLHRLTLANPSLVTALTSLSVLLLKERPMTLLRIRSGHLTLT